MKAEYYQVWLYSKELIQIFQNVFYYKIDTDKNFIVLKYSDTKNMGSFSVSERDIERVYDIKFINEPEFSIFKNDGNILSNPRDRKIIMHGAGKTRTYDPISGSWD